MGKVYNVEKRLFSKHPSLNRTRIRVTDDDLNDIRGLQTKHRRSSNLFFLPAIQVDRIFGANKENVSSHKKEQLEVRVIYSEFYYSYRNHQLMSKTNQTYH